MLAYSYARPVFSQIDQVPTLAASSLHQDVFHQPVYRHPTLVQNLAVETPSLKSGRFKSRNISMALTQLGRSIDMPSSTASARLPDEILSQIAIYALEQAFCGLDVATPTASSRKPAFIRIEGMTRSSRRLRAIALSEWFRLFLVRNVDDWAWAGRLKGMHSWVRHIICPPHALEAPAPSNVLATFPNLRSARLSLSCDYQFNPFPLSTNIYPSAPAELEVTPGFAYRQPVTAFPPTMTSLSVQSTHSSETPLLQNLGLQCPDLRALRLNKCTMFDCCTSTGLTRSQELGNPNSAESGGAYYGQIADGSECPFWGAFPFDHDIYFGSEGVEAYADELAAELSPLQKLEEISLGVYLTPHSSLAEHRLAHYPWRQLETTQMAANTVPLVDLPTPGPAHTSASTQHPVNPVPLNPDALFPFSPSQMPPPPYANPALWSYDCKACRDAYSDSTAAAERIAGLVLAQMLPKLKQIGWASFFDSRPPSHTHCGRDGQGDTSYRRGTGTHKWHVVRDEAGALIDLVRVH
ncbi:unnamed protein product [Rhizoctonia solani]|uniref:Uncharacterized protein n=2 Tax=Rhizoctonia solani TaxID=456999 RepID=A0A8H3A7Y0_9AGAM|nr:F-box-like domain protein [Rhizoctonia solani AG-3 Rhs1AP]CAE6405539.1 unnamed protein product [Rhizoctonia solani]CAE6407569.1 unnamed protein product [Rhizoctonia solani]